MIAVYLDGTDAPDAGGGGGTPLLDDDFLILVNAYWESVSFPVPEARSARQTGGAGAQTWCVELDSYDPSVSATREFPKYTGDIVEIRPRSVRVLRSPRSGEGKEGAAWAGRWLIGASTVLGRPLSAVSSLPETRLCGAVVDFSGWPVVECCQCGVIEGSGR